MSTCGNGSTSTTNTFAIWVMTFQIYRFCADAALHCPRLVRSTRRLRVGDYRIVYEVIDRELVVLVIRVALRRNAYR